VTGGRRHLSDYHLPAMLAAALLIRLAFWWFGPAFAPDEEYYRPLARNLWSNHSYSLDGRTPDTYWAPLAPFLVAPLLALDDDSGALAHALYVLLGVAAVGLVHGAAARVFGQPTARLAGWLAALYPWNILYSKSLNTQTLSVFLLSAGACQCAGWLAAERPVRPLSAVVTGALFGLATLASARGTLLLLCPLIVLLVRCPTVRLKTGCAALLLGGWAVLAAPWCVRNSLVSGQLQFTQTGAAQNLWIGAVYSYYGEFEPEGRPDDARYAYFRERFPEGPERDRALRQTAVRYIMRDPLRFVVHQTRNWLWISPSGHSVRTRGGLERTAALATAGIVNVLLLASLLGLVYLTFVTGRSALRGWIAFSWVWLLVTYVTTLPWGAPNVYRFSNGLDELLLIALAGAIVRVTTRPNGADDQPASQTSM